MSFTFLFYKHVMLRRSCQKCKYCNLKRPSDISLADFWGWKNTDQDINADDKGLSLVFLNTEKGKILFEKVRERMITIPAELDNCMQPNLKHPTVFDSRRNKFEQDYKNKGFEYVFKKYGENSLNSRIERYTHILTQKLKELIKVIIRRK